jgi:hypothetical protein
MEVSEMAERIAIEEPEPVTPSAVPAPTSEPENPEKIQTEVKTRSRALLDSTSVKVLLTGTERIIESRPCRFRVGKGQRYSR